MPKFFKNRLVVSKEESRDGWYSRGYFPHFDGEGSTQHVCFHLFDSLPYLRDDRLAEIVENALLHFDGIRYALHAWRVMPNHMHTLFTPEAGFKMSKIAHSWKSFTANKCNEVLERAGNFSERDPFDRYIRNERHYRNAVEYIENNPVKAGLCEKPEDWRWSSARRRATPKP